MTNPFEILETRLITIEKQLVDIQNLLQNQIVKDNPDELLNISQAAQMLNLSVPTIYGYVHRREIPVSKRGKRLYFSKHELLNWVKKGRLKTYTEIAEAVEKLLQKSRSKEIKKPNS